MKICLPLLAVVFAIAAPAFAQEPVPLEEAQRIAHALTEQIGSPSDAPFTQEVDADKPQVFKVGEAGFLVMPDRKLTADAIEHAGEKVTAIGQLWSRLVSVARAGQPAANDLLRFVKVGEGEKAQDAQLYFLGVEKNAAGEPQLLVFARDKEHPLLTVPLKKTEARSQSFPLEIDGRKEDDARGVLVIHVLGQYEAEVTVMKQAD